MTAEVDALALLLAGGGGPDATGAPQTLVETASVTAVTAGAGQGGSALVQVSWRGGLITARYLDTYTSPAVNDVVLLVHHADLPTILGRITGQPV